MQPVANRWHSDTARRSQVAHVRDRSNVSFQIRLQVGSKPKATSLRPSEHLWETSMQQIHLVGFRETERQELKDGRAACHRLADAEHQWSFLRAGKQPLSHPAPARVDDCTNVRK